MSLVTQPHRQLNCMPNPQELHQIIEITRVLGSTPFYQKLGPGGVLAIWLTARELGLPPMLALNGGLYTFDGKVTMSAQLMNMMIVNAGHRADVIRLDDKGCKLRFWRCDRKPGHGDVFEYEFTIEHATNAGYLGVRGPNESWIKKPKENWLTNPRDMCFNRALSGGYKKFMADLGNVYVLGEIEDKSFDDSHLENVMPTMALQEIKSIEEPKQTTEFFQFVNKYGLMMNSDGSCNDKMKYVLETCKRTGNLPDHIIQYASQNEQSFIETFDKWQKERSLAIQ